MSEVGSPPGRLRGAAVARPPRRRLLRWGGRLAVAALATLVGLAGLEVGLRLLFPDWLPLTTSEDFKRHSASRPRVAETYLGHDPVLGWAVKPGYRSAAVNGNNVGARGRRDVAAGPAPGIPRVILLGDSMAFGDEVADDQTMAVYLERALAGDGIPAEVINLAVPGYGVDQMVLRYEAVGRALAPDVVILAVLPSDVYRVTLDFRGAAKPRFAVRGGELVRLNGLLPTFAEQRVALHREFGASWSPLRTALIARHAFDRIALGIAPRRMECWRVTEAFLDRWLRGLRARGPAPVVAVVPSETSSFYLGDTQAGLIGCLAGYCEAHRLAFVDLREAFAEHRRRDASPLYHGHLSPLGNRVAGVALAARIAPLLRDRLRSVPKGRLPGGRSDDGVE